MTNKHASWYQFPNYGYVLYKFSPEQLIPLNEEVTRIQEKFDSFSTMNHKLAGNIKREYQLTDTKNYLDQILRPVIEVYDETFDYYKQIKVFSKTNENINLVLDDIWVNFQNKHEFNPTHSHSGILSFVIWLKIPYSIEDENKFLDTNIKDSNRKIATFNFYYTDTLGNIQNVTLPVDNTWENTVCIFPSSMKHEVYPFYSSEDYRISISGNYCIDNHLKGDL